MKSVQDTRQDADPQSSATAAPHRVPGLPVRLKIGVCRASAHQERIAAGVNTPPSPAALAFIFLLLVDFAKNRR